MNQMLIFTCGLVDKIIKGIFKPMVEALFKGAFGLLGATVSNAKDGLGMTPAEYAAQDGFEVMTGSGDEATTQVLYNGNGTGIIDQIIQNAIMPIATVILVYVVLYEFISTLMERNSFHDLDTSIFIRFIFKTTIAIYLVSHALDIVNALFDLGGFLVGKVTETADMSSKLTDAQKTLMTFLNDKETSGGAVVSLLIPALLFFLVTVVVYVCVFVCLFGRMMEIFINISVAPIPMATITNRDWDMGKNYIKLIFSYVLQAFFILIAIIIFGVLCATISNSIDAADVTSVNLQIFKVCALGVVLILAMFKSGNLAKSILNCH